MRRPDNLEGGFSRLYGELTGRGRVSEATVAVSIETNARLREKVVRCLWFDQFLDPETLRTADGRRLAVFSPGYWNESSGPDFRNAEIAFDDGSRQRGDVEIHVESSGWLQHGHEEDPAYDRVILHVVLDNNLPSTHITHRGRSIPQLVLRDHLTGDLQEILSGLDPEEYPRIGVGREGTCCRSIRAAGRDERWVGRFLDIAGDERMLRKAERFTARLRESTPDDVMYESIMETMGYSANRRGFRQIAESVPLALLRSFVPEDADCEERLLHTQGILMGAAGFLEMRPSRPLDEVSREQLRRLLAIWESARAAAGKCLNESCWRLHRTRPTNHPLRRLAGISAFFAANIHSGLCRAMMAAVESAPSTGSEARRCRETLDRFHEILEEPAQTFWARRTGFGPECLAHPTALIGATRTCEMIVNVVVPLLMALGRGADSARTEQRLHNVYCALRPRAENSIAAYMKDRIFDSGESAARVVNSMRRQQGLIQIFQDYCESNASTCESCGFLSAIERCDR